LKDLARRPIRLESEQQLEAIRRRDEDHAAELFTKHDWLNEPFPKLQPTYGEVAREYGIKDARIADPTTLILIDEADRLRMASLEQVRAIFDASGVGIVLIGMPGLEKRLGATRSSTRGSDLFTSFARWERQRSVGRWTNDGHQVESIYPSNRGPKKPLRPLFASRAETSGC